MNQNRTKTTRRDFVKNIAVAGAAVALGAGLKPALRAFTEAGDSLVNAAEVGGEWKPTTCQGCTSWCAAQVYVVGGRAIKVQGNPNSKVHGKARCPRMHLSLQQVYDPDRIKTPMKRTNPKKGRNEDPGFVPISWDEALNTIADKLMELRKNNETHKYLYIRGRYTLMTDVLYDQFAKIIGSPNSIAHSAICAEAEKFGYYYTEGHWDYKTYDLKSTRYLILWGTDPVAANRQVAFHISAWGDMLDRAKVAVVEPRLTNTGAKASEWLPIKPGQDGALAVAMAHVILTEGLWYKDFVGEFKDGVNKFVAGQDVNEADFTEKHTSGLVKWWNLELKDKTAKWAEEKTGIPADQIRRVAIGFAQAAPSAIVWYGRGAVMQVRGGYTAMAVNALNGLVGSVGSVGGPLYPISSPSGSYPSLTAFQDDAAKAGVTKAKMDQRGTKEFPALASGASGGGVVTDRTADAILAGDPYDVKVLIGTWWNFAFSCPQPERWERALAKIPFSASIVTHGSEVTWFNDIVLPAAHHMYEYIGSFAGSHGNRYAQISLHQPVIERMWEVKDGELEVTWLLAEKLAQKGFPNLLNYYKTFKDPETQKEPVNEKEFALFAVKVRTRPLWDPAAYTSGDKFTGWEDFRAKGVRNSAPFTAFKARWSNMATKTKKFEFRSNTLEAALKAHADKHKITIDEVLAACKYQAKGEKAFMPHYEEPFVWGSEAEYPLQFVDSKSRLNREGRSANCTWYQDFKDVDPGDVKWDDVAKFNPVDARKFGISDGDRIKLQSPTGEIECTAKLWEGVRPGTVAKTFGQGHWAYGRVAAKEFGKVPRGGNNNNLLPSDFERLSGASVFIASVRVKVSVISHNDGEASHK